MRINAALRVLAVTGPVAFVLVWLLVGDTQSGYSQLRETISVLAAAGAPERWIMVAGFVVLAAGLAAAAALTARTGRYGRPPPVLLGAAALGVLAAAAFPTGCTNSAWCRPVSDGTSTGNLHAAGVGLLFATLPLAMLAVARAARPDRWFSLLAFAVTVPLMGWLLLGWLLADVGTWQGVKEKALSTVLMIWVGWLAARQGRTRPAPVTVPGADPGRCRES